MNPNYQNGAIYDESARHWYCYVNAIDLVHDDAVDPYTGLYELFIMQIDAIATVFNFEKSIIIQSIYVSRFNGRLKFIFWYVSLEWDLITFVFSVCDLGTVSRMKISRCFD